jgi:hypothetical protein
LLTTTVPTPTAAPTTSVAPTVTPVSFVSTVTPAPTTSVAVTTIALPTDTVAPTIAVSTTTLPVTTLATTTAAKPTPTATAEPTPTPDSTIGKLANVIYAKSDGLYAFNRASSRSFKLSNDRIFKFVISSDNRAVAYYAIIDQHLELKVVTLNSATATQPHTLDSMVGTYTPSTQTNPYAGNYLRAYSLAFSPDNNLLAYSKMNLVGAAFNFWGTEVNPIEVWVGDVNALAVRPLVPNKQKDFMYNMVFSPDGARVGFIRTAYFPTDVSGTSAIYSVHKDGSSLALLEDGAVIGKQVTPSNQSVVGLIKDFSWTGSLGITFSMMGIESYSVWGHDLNSGKGWMLFNAKDLDNQSYFYDPYLQRYAFIYNKGLYTIGATNANDKMTLAKNNFGGTLLSGIKPINFYNSSLLFITESNTVAVQSINPDGSLLSVAMGLPALHKPNGKIVEALPAFGNWVVTWNFGDSKLYIGIFSGDGKTVLNSILPPILDGTLERLSSDLLLVRSSTGLQLLDLNGSTSLMTIY